MIIHRLFEVRYPIFGQAHITSDLCLAANLLWGRSQSEGMKFTLPAEHNVLPCLCHQPPMTTQSRSALNCYYQNMSARENPVLISCRGYLHIQVSTETKKFIEILLSSWEHDLHVTSSARGTEYWNGNASGAWYTKPCGMSKVKLITSPERPMEPKAHLYLKRRWQLRRSGVTTNGFRHFGLHSCFSSW